MKYTQCAPLFMGSLVFCTPLAHAQWSPDSAIHMVVADGPGEQVQPKIAPTPDGGCYISWFTSNTGYDVRLQRLDSQGNEMWAHNGIVIADRNFSSTQDYDLDVDTAGYAILAFRDTRLGGVTIAAQRVAPDGSPQWGPNGVQFSNGTDFVASPDIAATSDGSSVIAWINNADTMLAKIAPDGTIAWTKTITDPGGSSVNLASMHGSDAGSVVLSWVQFAAFFDPKHLYALKIDTDGSDAWASPAVVFDGGSLQFGNFPEFDTDGSGGAVFSWYDTANGLDVFAQHLASDGTELFAHNGTRCSTAAGERVSPAARYDAATDSLYVAWVELSNNQSWQGVSAQRFDTAGNRIWGDFGQTVSPTDSRESGSINLQIMEGDLVTTWIEGGLSFGMDTVHASRLDENGSPVWNLDPNPVASNPAPRSRLTTALSTEGFVIAGWQSGSTGTADIETHNINPDGTLGVIPCPADLTGDGFLNFFDVSAFLSAFASNDPAADFTGDGAYNFFDVSAFLSAFALGCP